MRSVGFTLLMLLGLFAAAPLAAQSDSGAQPYAVLAAMEARVATIGYRLTSANARWCPHLAPQFGWILGDPRLYSSNQWPLARVAYGASDRDQVYVAAVAMGGPAATAGIAVGTNPVSLNKLAPAPLGDDAFGRIAAWELAAAQLPLDAPVVIGLADGKSLTVTPVPGCASNFRVEAKDKPAAAADGRLVLVSAGLVRFAPDDNELAAAIAHELAHNILRHPARLDAADIDRGLLQQFGRNARLTRQTEAEADRLSVWLMAGAGYDPRAAIQFWTRFGKKYGGGIFHSDTHPRWRDRVASIIREIAAMHAARLVHPDALPPLIAAPPPLE